VNFLNTCKILHVLCRKIEAAITLLNVATSSGYRESGISISGLNTAQEKVIVAVRTTSFRLDVPLASYDEQSQLIRPFGFSRDNLASLIFQIDEMFRANTDRKDRLVHSLREAFQSQILQVGLETKEERRARKRIEGMHLQAAKNANVSQEDVQDNKDDSRFVDGVLGVNFDTN
jgi:tRNA(Phe) wybutosine-synthesizing methylase Tyw3